MSWPQPRAWPSACSDGPSAGDDDQAEVGATLEAAGQGRTRRSLAEPTHDRQLEVCPSDHGSIYLVRPGHRDAGIEVRHARDTFSPGGGVGLACDFGAVGSSQQKVGLTAAGADGVE